MTKNHKNFQLRPISRNCEIIQKSCVYIVLGLFNNICHIHSTMSLMHQRRKIGHRFANVLNTALAKKKRPLLPTNARVLCVRLVQVRLI